MALCQTGLYHHNQPLPHQKVTIFLSALSSRLSTFSDSPSLYAGKLCFFWFFYQRPVFLTASAGRFWVAILGSSRKEFFTVHHDFLISSPWAVILLASASMPGSFQQFFYRCIQAHPVGIGIVFDGIFLMAMGMYSLLTTTSSSKLSAEYNVMIPDLQ